MSGESECGGVCECVCMASREDGPGWLIKIYEIQVEASIVPLAKGGGQHYLEIWDVDLS